MSMVYLGNSEYFDTDNFDNESYTEFCKHRDNLKKYYTFKDNKSAILKAKMLGTDIAKMISDAENFIAEQFYGLDSNWKEYVFGNDVEDVLKTVECIALGLEE